MSKRSQCWAYYDVNMKSLLLDIWDSLDEEMPNYYSKELDPHITIHPRFEFDQQDQGRFEHYVYENFPNNISVTVHDFYYHPKRNRPMVICFDIQTNIQFQARQNELCTMIAQNGGYNVVDTAPPHVTIYKSNDQGKNVRSIPPNTNKIKRKCQKLKQRRLPITIPNAQLKIKKMV